MPRGVYFTPQEKHVLSLVMRKAWNRQKGGEPKGVRVRFNPLVSVPQCPKCGRLQGERHKVTTKPPSLATMERWIENGVAKATDGCRVEPDGVCQHGHNSWLTIRGYV